MWERWESGRGVRVRRVRRAKRVGEFGIQQTYLEDRCVRVNNLKMGHILFLFLFFEK